MSEHQLPQQFVQKNKNKKHKGHLKSQDVSHLFNKKFKFQKCFPSTLPEFSRSSIVCKSEYVYEDLQVLKCSLNSVKSRLNDFPIEEWSLHTRKRNPAGEIQWKLRTGFNTEFVTQAWCKMFECLSSYNLVGQLVDQHTFSSVHLCEAPGAFIAALNHYLKTNYQDAELKWFATTLNPYYEGNQVSNMILDDRFMLHTLDNWYFGCDFTGNIMDKKNIYSLKDKCEQIQPIMLVTADGSINCLHTPEEQENKVAFLHIYEVLSALLILYSGGSFLLKMFTFFEHSSVCILYLLNIAFETVNVFKPVTSKSGNSEVYVICQGYKRDENVLNFVNLILDELDVNTTSEQYSLFRKEDIPVDFIGQVTDCARYFMNFQCKVIEDNIVNYDKSTPFHVMKSLRGAVTNFFMTLYKVKSIEENLKIVRGIDYYSAFNLNPRLHLGSYNERTKPQSYDDKKNLLWNRYSNFQQYHWPLQDCLKYLPNDTKACNLSLVCGKPINTLCSSKFILAPILDLYKQAFQLCNSNLMQNVNVEAWYIIHHDCRLRQRFICLVNDEYLCNNGSNYDELEKKLLKKILELNISEGENLAIWNFPTLTLFSVGILYILTKYYFKKVAFLRYNCILFFAYSDRSKQYLQEIMHKINILSTEPGDTSILSVVPVDVICRGEFYENILMFNNANLMCKSYALLSSPN